MFLVELANDVQDRQRRTAELARDAPRDLLNAAATSVRQQPRPLQDRIALDIGHLREVRGLGHLVLVYRHEPFDAREKETHPAFAVGEDEPSRRQTFATPALDRLAGDVEFLGHVIDRKHWLSKTCRMLIE